MTGCCPCPFRSALASRTERLWDRDNEVYAINLDRDRDELPIPVLPRPAPTRIADFGDEHLGKDW